MADGMSVENVPENLLVVDGFRAQVMDALGTRGQRLAPQADMVAEKVTLIEFHGHINGTRDKVTATVCLDSTAAGMLLADLIDGSL